MGQYVADNSIVTHLRLYAEYVRIEERNDKIIIKTSFVILRTINVHSYVVRIVILLPMRRSLIFA